LQLFGLKRKEMIQIMTVKIKRKEMTRYSTRR